MRASLAGHPIVGGDTAWDETREDNEVATIAEEGDEEDVEADVDNDVDIDVDVDADAEVESVDVDTVEDVDMDTCDDDDACVDIDAVGIMDDVVVVSADVSARTCIVVDDSRCVCVCIAGSVGFVSLLTCVYP